MTDHTDELAGLPEDVREAVRIMDAGNAVNGAWNACRDELTRLSRENAELRRTDSEVAGPLAIKLHERAERAEAELIGAGREIEYQVKERRKVEAELAALKRRIAEARTITPDVGEDGDYINVWFSGDENRHTFALLPVGGE